jgi:hypothetical protein
MLHLQVHPRNFTWNPYGSWRMGCIPWISPTQCLVKIQQKLDVDTSDLTFWALFAFLLVLNTLVIWLSFCSDCRFVGRRCSCCIPKYWQSTGSNFCLASILVKPGKLLFGLNNFWLVSNILYFPEYIGNNHPNLTFIFFRGVGQPPTMIGWWLDDYWYNHGKPNIQRSGILPEMRCQNHP